MATSKIIEIIESGHDYPKQKRLEDALEEAIFKETREK
jgi:hypothetical protein